MAPLGPHTTTFPAAVFARSGAGLLALVAAFDSAPSAVYGLGDHDGPPVTPATPQDRSTARVQLGAIGSVSAADFARFPAAAVGRLAAA